MTTEPTGHLPECPTASLPHEVGLCICDRLRACEARVREEMRQPDPGINESAAYARAEGYAKALDAAADVVAALESFDVRPYTNMEYQPGVYKDNALAAIDALRGE